MERVVHSCHFNYKWKTRITIVYIICVASRSDYIVYEISLPFHLVREDINRHKADRITNSRPIEVLNKEKKCFEKRPQGSIRVGDIVRVNEGDIIPADLVFLRSGDPKAPKSCWVNTKSLDGETDNKYRQALKV